LLTSVQHRIENTLNYFNNFTAIPFETTIPENTDPNFVKCAHNQIGWVADNNDPQKLGRVKVGFWWMEDGQMSPWIKVLTPYTHKNSGFYFIPEINSRALVGFEDGDVEKPYCLGMLFDKDANPDPEWAGNYDRSNANAHVIRTQSGQTIEWHDKKGKEKIRIYDTNNKNEITLNSAEGDILIKATNKIVINSKEILIKADGGIKIEATGNLEQKGKDITAEAQTTAVVKGNNVELKANASLKAEGSASAEISSGGIATLKGSLVKIN
jgi:type VI secretion system secreted protein VgrG